MILAGSASCIVSENQGLTKENKSCTYAALLGRISCGNDGIEVFCGGQEKWGMGS